MLETITRLIKGFIMSYFIARTVKLVALPKLVISVDYGADPVVVKVSKLRSTSSSYRI